MFQQFVSHDVDGDVVVDVVAVVVPDDSSKFESGPELNPFGSVKSFVEMNALLKIGRVAPLAM